MSVFTEYLDHARASETRPGPDHRGEKPNSSDYLMTGLLMRAVMCLTFIGAGAVLSLI